MAKCLKYLILFKVNKWLNCKNTITFVYPLRLGNGEKKIVTEYYWVGCQKLIKCFREKLIVLFHTDEIARFCTPVLC